jgi:2-polyprenyl-3-methyl-5-hydroxy-6-metoxy-1,4-benzoquinol methylase
VNCPVCASGGPHAPADTWLDPVDNAPYKVFLCSGCGVGFADPFKNPGAAWYARFSSAASYEESPKHQFNELLRGRDGRGKKLLDIGCGNGVFLAMAERAGFEVFGIDFNTEAVNGARARGLKNIFLGDLRAFRARYPDLKFDIVSYFDCIEHLDDPNGELDAILETIKAGGLLALNTPNSERPLPFGRDYFDMPPHHLTRWTARSLAALLERHGLEITKLDSSYLPVWEFSRRFISAVTGLAMKAARKLLLPRGTPGSATFTQVMAEPGATGPLRSAASRQKLVRAFHGVLHVLTFPVFVWMMLYYKVTRPGQGTQLFVTASRRRQNSLI